jgi:hypothetical protein
VRELDAGLFRDRVTFISGPGRASGKTSLLGAALLLLRREGQPFAILGLGFDGEGKGGDEAKAGTRFSEAGRGDRESRISVAAGEIFVSAESWLRGSPVCPEILAALPDSSALGRLAIARATRSGEVILVGPGRNDLVSEAIRLCQEEFGARSVIVDGAFDRLTQVSAVPGARHIQALRIDSANLSAMARKMRLVAMLAALPRFDAEAKTNASRAEVCEIVGPLTASVLLRVGDSSRGIVVDDMTKIFLEESELGFLLRRRRLLVRRSLDFSGFVLVLQGVNAKGLFEALGRDFPSDLLIRNPYEVEVPVEVD